MRLPKQATQTKLALCAYVVALVCSYKQELKDYIKYKKRG